MGGGHSAPNNRRHDAQNQNPSGNNPQNRHIGVNHAQHAMRQQRNSPQRNRGGQPLPSGKVIVMNNDISLIANSVKLVKSTTNPNLYSVTFAFDSLFESIISAFFFVHDMRDPLLEITYELTPDEKYQIAPKHLKYPAGRNIKIAENCYCLEIGKYSEEELSHHTNELYPLIIRIEKIDPMKKDKKVFFYYFHFVKDEGEMTIKLIRQKMELNGQAFEVNEIYGINSTEFGKEQGATIGDSEKECIICFSDQRDTIILPCRHMCLCINCAKSLQAQSNSKCPICRKDIESFLRLTKNHQKGINPNA